MRHFLVPFALLVAAGCGSGGNDEITGSNAGAATVSELGGATASKATLEIDRERSQVTYPVIHGGGMSNAELAELNREVKKLAEDLLANANRDVDIECLATLATRELAAVACSITTPNGATSSHAALHFSPQDGKRVALSKLLTSEDHAIDLDTAVVTRNGLIVQENAVGRYGYELVTWKDLDEPNDALTSLASSPPLAGDAAWRWHL